MKFYKKILVILVVVLGIIIIGNVKNQYSENNTNNISDNSNSSNLNNSIEGKKISEEEQKDILNELVSIASKNDKNVIMKINEEDIYQKDMELYNYLYNNNYIKESDSSTALIKDKVILQNAKENDILLSNNEIESINASIEKGLEQEREILNSILQKFDFKEKEFVKYYTNYMQNEYLIMKWQQKIIKKIYDEEIDIDYQQFNLEYEEYKNTTDTSIKTKKLNYLVDIYIKYLIENSDIIYF